MRSQVSGLLRRTRLSRGSGRSRTLTTTSDPKKAMQGLAIAERDDLFDDNIKESELLAVPLPNADILSYTLKDINKWQHKVATECGISGRRYTYAELLDGALRFSTLLGRFLPQNGGEHTVAFLTPNVPEYPIMFFGAMARGVTVVPINPMFTVGEISHYLKDSDASVFVVDSLFESRAESAVEALGKHLPIIVNGESQKNRPNVQRVIRDPTVLMSEPVLVDPRSIAMMPYSSGTTGKPKGVLLSHAALTNNMALFMNNQIARTKNAEGEHQETLMGILPFFHIYGIMAHLLPTAQMGAKVVTMPMFDPEFFIEALKKNKMTSLQVVPPLLNFIAKTPEITSDDLGALHSFIVGGSSVPVPVASLLKEKVPRASFQEGFGMSEILLSHVTPHAHEKIGYCGQLLPNCRAKVIDMETGESLPANSKGELCILTPSVMSGYHNNEAATRHTIDQEGWVHTGDVAYYTEDGYYSICDRIKELIKVKGYQVSPSEVEEVLLELPGVVDVGVVGVPHERFGEAPLAFIVRENERVTETDVQRHMDERLANYKQLAGGIKFVEELPKNAGGKLLRRILKEMAQENS